jgi:predicted nucleic acid-binding protein
LEILLIIVVHSNDTIIESGKNLNILGFSKKDALHITCAIESKSDLFITTDKDIIRKRNIIKNIKILGPIEFINIIEENYENLCRN